jgi:hypothetical protein
MDNNLYIIDDTEPNTPSSWWRNFNYQNLPLNLEDCANEYLKIFNEYNADVIIKDKRMIGLSFSSDNQKTAFLLKYG